MPATGLPSRLPQSVALMLLAAVVLHVVWAATKPVTSDDLWWGMAAGRYIVEHHSVPDHDVLSYTHAGAPWINGEWLSQVIEYRLYQFGTGLGVALFKLVVVSIAFAIVAWMSWRRSRSAVITALVVACCAYVCRPYFDLRSQLFLFLCATLMLGVVESYRSGAPVWVLALYPAIIELWVNTHYSFLFGAGLLAMCAGAEFTKTWLGLPHVTLSAERARRLAAASGVAVLAALANPFGARAFTHPFSIIGSETDWRRYIIEWVPPVLFAEESFNPAIFGYVLIAQLALTGAACVWAHRRLDLTDGLLFAATLVMALSARRFVPIFALVGAPFVAPSLSLLRDPVITRVRGVTAAIIVALLAVAASVIPVTEGIAVGCMVRTRGLFDVLVGGDYFPAGATDFLSKNPLPGRLFHPYTWGGYLAFHLPHQLIFIDGRAHTVYPLPFYREYLAVENGSPGWPALLERHEIALIVWPENAGFGTRDTTAMQQFKVSADWLLVYSDGHAAVFAHRDRGAAWITAFRHGTLVYPDLPDAQLFAAISYWNANQFDAARRHFAAAMPLARTNVQEAERSFLQPAQTQNSARAWFNVGFFRELNDDRAGAAEAFRRATSIGLNEPDANVYAMAALERLVHDD